MKWYDYRPFIPKWAKFYGVEPTALSIGKSSEFKAWMRKCSVEVDEYFPYIKLNHIWGEDWWIKNGRPYYDLYPGIAEAFLKVDLEKILGEHLNPPFPAILIRFAADNDTGICTALVTYVREDDGRIQIATAFDEINDPVDTFPHGNIPKHQHGGCNIPPGETILDPGAPWLDSDHGKNFYKILQIYTTICLIRKNPDLIEQQPLSTDMARFESAADFETRQKLLDKAQRRGKLAFAIGKHIETAAGFRHPHFAIRWMGHGEPKTPVLRPIKGCIVNRKKITDVPTGYLDDLETDLNPVGAADSLPVYPGSKIQNN